MSRLNTTLLLLSCCFCIPTFAQGNLPDRIIVGYWHNWTSPNALLLSAIPNAYDVINIAFATPTTPSGATMRFVPEQSLYPTQQQFIDHVQLLHSRGKKVLISVGGASDPVQVRDTNDVRNFANSMRTLITTYGFDGMDIDLEGQSLSLQAGDTDFRNPTSPLILNFISAVKRLMRQLPSGTMLTAAPETAFMQGGFGTYAGIWGAYLPVIHALRDQLTYVHVQHYNTGSMFGRDGRIYQPATADFHVAMADALLGGFRVNNGFVFPPLTPAQVVIGLPASANAAGSGFTPPAVVQIALSYLIRGHSFGGSYVLSNPTGYELFRGLMTWSINWDVANGNQFSAAHRRYLDSLSTPTAVNTEVESPQTFHLSQNYPNPFNPLTTVSYSMPHSEFVTLKVFDLLGREVATLVSEPVTAGVHNVNWNASHVGSGVYFYELNAGSFRGVKRMVLLK